MKKNANVKITVLAVVVFAINISIGLLYKWLGDAFVQENSNAGELFIIFMITVETILFYWAITNFLERFRAEEEQQDNEVRLSGLKIESLTNQLKELKKETEEQSSQLLEKLEDVKNQKNRFLENLQKKIKNKTEALENTLNLLASEKDISEIQKKVAENASSLASLVRVIDDLYLFSSSEKDLSIKPINLDNLISIINPDIKVLCEKNGIEFQINFVFDRIFEETSDPESSIFMNADMDAVSKALTSCIISCIRMLDNSGNVQLAVGLDHKKGSDDEKGEIIVFFEVNHSGKDFSEGRLNEISRRIYSDGEMDWSDSNDEDLDIIFAATSVQMMDGSFHLPTKEDNWKFRIEMPRRPKKKPILDLLIVDDDESVRDALNLTFTVSSTFIEHFQVAEDAAEARQILDKFDFCCCLLDARMPEEDGASLMQFIEQSSPFAKRVMLTGQADKELLQRTVNDGKAHMILYKPWNNDDLIEILETMIKDSDLFSMKEDKDIKTLWKK